MNQRPPRLIARMLLMLVPLFLIGLAGMLWGGSNLPETSRNWFGGVLIGDIIRPVGYALGLIVVGWALGGCPAGSSRPHDLLLGAERIGYAVERGARGDHTSQ